MNSPIKPPCGELHTSVAQNPDLVEQAVRGHGVPSHDPDPAAQVRLTPNEAEREAKSVYVGGGAVAGLGAGAAAGAVIGGSVGELVGCTAGTIAGVLGGELAGQAAEPEPRTPLDRLPARPRLAAAMMTVYLARRFRRQVTIESLKTSLERDCKKTVNFHPRRTSRTTCSPIRA